MWDPRGDEESSETYESSWTSSESESPRSSEETPSPPDSQSTIQAGERVRSMPEILIPHEPYDTLYPVEDDDAVSLDNYPRRGGETFGRRYHLRRYRSFESHLDNFRPYRLQVHLWDSLAPLERPNNDHVANPSNETEEPRGEESKESVLLSPQECESKVSEMGLSEMPSALQSPATRRKNYCLKFLRAAVENPPSGESLSPSGSSDPVGASSERAIALRPGAPLPGNPSGPRPRRPRQIYVPGVFMRGRAYASCPNLPLKYKRPLYRRYSDGGPNAADILDWQVTWAVDIFRRTTLGARQYSSGSINNVFSNPNITNDNMRVYALDERRILFGPNSAQQANEPPQEPEDVAEFIAVEEVEVEEESETSSGFGSQDNGSGEQTGETTASSTSATQEEVEEEEEEVDSESYIEEELPPLQPVPEEVEPEEEEEETEETEGDSVIQESSSSHS